MTLQSAFERDNPLLALLLRAPRAPLVQLADALGTTRQAVWRQLRKLEQGAIRGYATVINEHAVGWRRYLILIKFTSPPANLAAIRSAVEAEVEAWDTLRIVSEFVTSGDPYDYTVDVAVASRMDATAFVTTLKQAAPGQVAHVDLMEVVDKVRDAGVGGINA